MAVWGGRFKFDDVSITRRDFSRHGPPGSYTRLQERVTSAPASSHLYKPRQPLRPKDTFVSPQAPIVGSSQQRPCPLGCPCNQSDRVVSSYETRDLDNALATCNRWCSSNQDNNYYGPNLSSHSQYKTLQTQAATMQNRLKQNQNTRPMSHYIVRPPPYIMRERPHSSYTSNNNVYMPMPVRTQPIPPRNGIPVGWGHVDLNTVYHEHYTDPRLLPEIYAQSSYVPIQQPRSESPPRWETSYSSAFCKHLLQVTKAF